MNMISEEVLALEPDIIAWRRHMHQNPELSFQEVHTTAYLTEELKKIPGLTLEFPTKTGVVAVLKGVQPVRCWPCGRILTRFPFRRRRACPLPPRCLGSCMPAATMAMAAMQLAAAKLLAAERTSLKGEVRFLFQHAEELPPGGAVEMLKAGVMKGVDELYGMHLSSNFPTGTFGVRPGALTSATDRFDIRVIGKGGHSAFPETCVDPIVIAGEIVGALQTLVSRRIQAVEPAVVSVCMIHAGEAYNIIPGEVAITGSTRTFSKETRERLPKLMEELARGICAAHGADCDFKFTLGYASVMNDKALTASSRKVIEEHFGESAVLEIVPCAR